MRFPGQYFDAETGLHYNYHRFYDPTTGRYMTPDPIGLEGGINLYTYAENDPIDYFDPWGLDPTLVSGFSYLPPNFKRILSAGGGIGGGMLRAPMGGGTHGTSSSGYIRIRHYTNSKGLEGIRRDNIIRASDQNKVFAESCKKKPLSPRDAEAKYGLKRGRGRHFVETDVPVDRVQRMKNPKTRVYELQIRGDVPLTNSVFITR
jgi:RHS repeat-associated protein